MKEIHFCVIFLAYLSLSLAKLDRKIEINKCTDTEATTTRPKRTLRTYRTKETPPITRRTTTQPAVIDKTCLLIPDEGPCRGKILMWYFDPENMSCSTFNWGGCQGNGNRFDYRKDCLDTCMTKPGYKEGRPNYCLLRFDYGWCFGADERWYFDQQWGVCRKTIYSGCGGNKNNFYNIEQCDQICRFGLKPLTHISRSKNTGVKKILIVNPPDPNEKKEDKGGKGKKTVKPTKARVGKWWLEDLKGLGKMSFKINRDEDKEKEIAKEEYERQKKLREARAEFEKQADEEKNKKEEGKNAADAVTETQAPVTDTQAEVTEATAPEVTEAPAPEESEAPAPVEPEAPAPEDPQAPDK